MKTNFFIYISVLILLVSCQKEQEARKPVAYASGSFIRQSAERNKMILKEQEHFFDALRKKNKSRKYISTPYGFWFAYDQKSNDSTVLPVKGDFIFFDLELRNTENKPIYPANKFKNRQYQVDKENIMTGLREGLKLLRENDKATFYLPSQFAYGFHGDNNNIKTNVPLIVKVKINKIIRQAEILAEKKRKQQLDSIAAAQLLIMPEMTPVSVSMTEISNTSNPNAPKTTATNTTSNLEVNPLPEKKPEIKLPPRKKVKPLKVKPTKTEIRGESLPVAPLLEQPIIINPKK